jgi:ribonuclease III
METFESFVTKLPVLEEKLGYNFKNRDLLVQAFVHRSFLNEQKDFVKEHNERLEFLGDSVLGLIIAEYLFLKLPGHPEGELSRLRSQLVEAGMCSFFASKLDLYPFVLLGKGERMSEGRGRNTIMADAMEALIAAIYLDSNFDTSKEIFLRLFEQDIEAQIHEPGKNWKAKLQDWAQKHRQTTPIYKVVSELGPDHSKRFVVVATIGDEVLESGEGMSKKLAEQAAAEATLRKLEKQDG